MKSVLVILTQANLSLLQLNESLAATMVLATFGTQIKVLLQDAAISLLQSDILFDAQSQAFKPASNMVDSFEFYDLTPILVDATLQNHPLVKTTQNELVFIDFNADLIQSFDYVLYW